MSNALVILLGYGLYLLMVGAIAAGAWYAEKLDPDNDLPDSLLDEIFPCKSKGKETKRNELNWLSTISGKPVQH